MLKKITIISLLFILGIVIGTFSTAAFAKSGTSIQYMDQFWFDTTGSNFKFLKTDINKFEDNDEGVICYTATAAKSDNNGTSTAISCIKKTDK